MGSITFGACLLFGFYINEIIYFLCHFCNLGCCLICGLLRKILTIKHSTHSWRNNWVVICIIDWTLLSFNHWRITTFIMMLQILMRFWSCKLCKEILWRRCSLIVILLLLLIILYVVLICLGLLSLLLRLRMRTLFIEVNLTYLFWYTPCLWFRFCYFFRRWRSSHLLMAISSNL